MKRMMIVCLIAGLLPVISMSAQTTPPENMAMLVNKAALKSYASANLGGGVIHLWSGGMNYATNISPFVEIWTNVGSPNEMLGLLSSQSMSYAVLSPSNDTVRAYCYLYDQSGRIVFRGVSEQFQMVQKVDGGWTTPSDALKFGVGFVGKAAISLGAGAYGAQLIERNDQGHIIDYLWIEADDYGKVVVPSSWCGRGHLLTYYNDGVQVAYDLTDGGRKVYSSIQTVNATLGLEDFFTVSESSGLIEINPESNNGQGSAKIAQVDISFDRWMLCSGVTSEGEKASVVVVRDLVNKTISTYPIANGQNSVYVLMKKGQYQVYMIWSYGFDEDEKAEQAEQPDDGGGKGKSEG